MKKTSASHIFWTDRVHDRIDLRRGITHALFIFVTICWALVGAAGFRDAIMRLAVASALVVFCRLLLSRLGASRLTVLGLTIATLITVQPFSIEQLLVIDIFIFAMLLLQEFFIMPKKHYALVIGVLLGLLVGLANGVHVELAMLIFFVLTVRLAMYVIVRKLSKKAFVLFIFKTGVIVATTLALGLIIHSTYDAPYVLSNLMPDIFIPTWVMIIAVVFAIKGLGATLLLKTKRSPEQRDMRIFYIGLFIILAGLSALLDAYGARIFLPSVIDKLQDAGLRTDGFLLALYGTFVTFVLINGGIDRMLSTAGHNARLLSARLGIAPVSSNKMSQNE